MTQREGRSIDTYIDSLFQQVEGQMQEVKYPSPIKGQQISGQGMMQIQDGPIQSYPWNDSISLLMQKQDSPGLNLKEQSPCQKYFVEPSFENMHMISRSTPSINELQENESERKYKSSQLQGLYQKVMSFYQADHINLPFFFNQAQNEGLTQLICFQITKKNSKYIIYDPVKMTCLPQFKCYGCKKVFQTPNGLGGHLSRCPKKKQHMRQIDRLSRIDENGSIKVLDSSKGNKMETDVRKSKRVGKKSVFKRRQK